jgi:glucokinase
MTDSAVPHNPGGENFFAVDLGGTGTAVGLVTANGEILNRSRFSSLDFIVKGAPELFVEKLVLEFQQLLAGGDWAAPGHVGIGAPDGNFFNGSVQRPSNLAWDGHVPLTELVAQATGMGVRLDNDANVAALGEGLFGAGRGVNDFVAVTLGTGVGSGIICGGQVVRGADGSGGELGHLTVVPGGRLCSCGGLGCLETYASASGLIRTVSLGVHSGASGAGEFDLRHLEADPDGAGVVIYERAMVGNPLALDAFRLVGESLGMAFSQVQTLLSPELYVLSGGLTAAGDLLLKPLRARFHESGAKFHSQLPPIVNSACGPGDAALQGAASLWFS